MFLVSDDGGMITHVHGRVKKGHSKLFTRRAGDLQGTASSLALGPCKFQVAGR